MRAWTRLESSPHTQTLGNTHMRAILMIFFCFLLSGCVGVQFIGTKYRFYEKPHLKSDNGVVKYASDNGRSDWSEADIVKIWGKPNQIMESDGVKKLLYKRGLRWNGLYLFIVFPIPIQIPTGYLYSIATFEDNEFKHVESQNSEALFSAVCIFPPFNPAAPNNCEAIKYESDSVHIEFTR